MGEPRPFQREKLVIAVLIAKAALSDLAFRKRLEARLEQEFGSVDYTSEELPFAFTRYYDAELGTPLYRYFVAFSSLVAPQSLARLKLATNALEDEFRSEPGRARALLGERGPRRVNLDPGLLSRSRFVLASTKDSSHRIPLAEGIYAEVTLQYRRPCFRPLPWTYPDYRSEKVGKVLLEIRRLLKAQTKTRGGRRSIGGGKRELRSPSGPQPG